METIDLDHKLEYKGYWFLPSAPDKKIAGILTYYPNEKIILELLGCFDEYSWSILAETGEEAIISGKTSDSKDITLLNAFRSIRIKGGADFPIVRYTCDFLVIGTHVKGLDDKRNYWATARIPELTLWCQPKALNTTMFFGKNKTIERINVSFSTEFRSRKDVISRINVSDNTAIIIKKGVRYNGDHLAPEIEQYSYLVIRKTRHQLRRFLQTSSCSSSSCHLLC